MNPLPVNATATAGRQATIQSIVYVGAFGPPSLTFARSCAARGIKVYLLEAGVRRRLQSACIAGYGHLPQHELYRSEGIQCICRFADEAGAQAVIALTERHIRWLVDQQAAFAGRVKLLLPTAAALSRLSAKETQLLLARQVGLNILPTYLLRSRDDVSLVPPQAYPLCLRPSTEDGVEPTFKVEIIRSPALLGERLSTLRIVEPVIGQPFLMLPNLVVHGVRSEQDGECRMAAFLVDRKFEGVTLRIRRFQISPGLQEQLTEYVRRAGLTGPFHYELLYDMKKRESYFLEINTRLGGTTDKVLWLGYDEAALCLEAYGYHLPAPSRSLATKRPTVVNKRTILKHMVYALRGRLGPLDYPAAGTLKSVAGSLRDLVLACDSVWDWGDWTGTRAYHLR